MDPHIGATEKGRDDANNADLAADRASDTDTRQLVPWPGIARLRTRRTLTAMLAHILTPRTILSAFFGLGLLAAVLALGNPSRAWHLIVRTGWQTVLIVAVLTVPYLAGRFFVWRNLLAKVDVTLYWRPILTAFGAGEFSKSLPGGIYVEDYLLKRCCDVPVSSSIIATTAVSALEILVATPVVLSFGIPGWGALRPTLGGVLMIYAIGAGIVWWAANPGGQDVRLRRPARLAAMIRGVRHFLRTARPLLRLTTLRDNLVPIALSLSIVAVDIWLLGQSSEIHGLSLLDAAVVYGFTTLTLVLTPVPTDLGTTEASGAAALLAFGGTAPQAVATLLLLRILLTGSTMLITGLLMIALARRWI